MTERRAELVLSQWVTSIMIAIHFGLGAAILIGGQGRFQLPTYQPLIDITRGETWLWGLVITVSACLMMIPYRWPNIAGLFIGMFWMNLWAALFAVSVVQYEKSAATPMVAYLGFALINAALLTARVLDRGDDEPR